MEQFIEEDEDSKPLDAADDAWADPQRVADDLGQELPNAEVTDEVTPVVDAGDRRRPDERVSHGREHAARADPNRAR